MAYQVIDGCAFLVQPKDHTLHRLDEVGTLIWEVLERPVTADQIADRIAEVFDVEPGEARSDALEFLEALSKKNLAEAVEG